MLGWVLLALVACEAPEPSLVPEEPAPEVAARGPHPLTGTLVDHAGAPIGNAHVLACTSGYCQDTTTGADGTFRLAVKRPVTLALKADGVVGGPERRAAALLPGIEAGAAPVDVGEVYAPDLAPAVRLPAVGEGPRTIELGDGLALTLDRDALRPPVHTFLYEAAARRLPDARTGPFGALVGERIVAVYAIDPFGTTSAAPIAVAIPSDLPPGAPVHFWTFRGTDGVLSAPVPGQADGATARTAPGQGIGELSYLVVTDAR